MHMLLPRFVVLLVFALVAGSLQGIPTALAETSVQGRTGSEELPGVGALGRIEPLHGVYELQAPSGLFPARLSKLLVEEGDKVKQGQVVAIIDNMQTLPSDVARSRAEAVARRAAFEQAQRDFNRYKALVARGAISRDAFEQASKRYKQAAAQLQASRSEVQSRAGQLARVDIVAPVSGTILKIHARDGESVPWNTGVLAMGMTDHMMAVAEVYEDDILKVRPGLRAVVTSRALPEPLHGTVERIGEMVEEPRDYSPDPAENTQARVVKVHIRLDEPEKVEHLTGLLVHVVIGTGK